FPHFDVARVIQELLDSLQAGTGSKAHYEFQKRCVISTGERIYDELHSGTFWRDVEVQAREQLPGVCVLPIILYVDGVLVDFFGKVSMTPVMLTLGNFDAATRETLAAKRLVGFVPSLSEEEIRMRTTKSTSAVRREILHCAFAKYAIHCVVCTRFLTS